MQPLIESAPEKKRWIDVPHRLHIGAMGPHSPAHPAVEKLSDPSWIHLGVEVNADEVARRFRRVSA